MSACGHDGWRAGCPNCEAEQEAALARMDPVALRRRADLIESKECTGLAASWCPVHGDCTCPRTDPDADLDDPGCPLHSPASSHAAGAFS